MAIHLGSSRAGVSLSTIQTTESLQTNGQTLSVHDAWSSTGGLSTGGISLTLCPLMPGRPGVPGKPRAPWGKVQEKGPKLLSLLWFCSLVIWNFISSLTQRTCGPAGPRSPARPGLPDSPWEKEREKSRMIKTPFCLIWATERKWETINSHPRRSFQEGQGGHGDPWLPAERNNTSIRRVQVTNYPCVCFLIWLEQYWYFTDWLYSQQIRPHQAHQGGQWIPEVPVRKDKKKHGHFYTYTGRLYAELQLHKCKSPL